MALAPVPPARDNHTYPASVVVSISLDPSTGLVAAPAKTRPKRRYYDAPGAAQLSLVEHALCALDPAVSLARDYRHHTGFHYTDELNSPA